MKISLNWLKEYIDLDLSVEEIAEILTHIGLEVEGIDYYYSVRGGLEGLVVGHVKELNDHPDADRLKLAKVDIGNSKALQIVCGAPNISKGQNVIVAQPGTTIYPAEGDPVKIEAKEVRGKLSEGMICAEDEIGLGHQHKGIMVLPMEIEPGKAAKEYFNIEEDIVFEIDLTPNRSDALHHIGVARDLKAYLQVFEKEGLEMKEPNIDSFQPDNQSRPIEVEVANERGCPRYAGLTLTDVTVAPSPEWLQHKLRAIEVEPINNVVDVTNYVLWEMGQPLHAFDADQIKGDKIIVKTLQKGSKFTTLDEVERVLADDDLMICDEKDPLCMAGVLGGLESGVKESTQNIFLESAYFDPTFIRRTAERHEIHSDAANRFEKGADPEVVITALKRAALLIKEVTDAEIASDIVDHYPKPLEPHAVDLSYDYLNTLVGQELPPDLVKRILNGLEIEVENETKKELQLKIPRYRVDVQRPADVAEEILRIYGYNKIEYSDRLNYQLPLSSETRGEKAVEKVSDLLTGNGFHEMINNSLIDSNGVVEDHFSEEEVVPILNYSSEELDIMRPSLLYSGLGTLRYNQNQGNENQKLFEFGKRYEKKSGKFKEEHRLSLLLMGQEDPEGWYSASREVDFYQLKGYTERVFEAMGATTGLETTETQHPAFQYGLDYSFDDGRVGTIGLVRADFRDNFELKEEVYWADLNWELLLDHQSENRVRYQGVPKYPAVRRDLSLLLNENVSFEEIRQMAYEQEDEILRDVNLFDVYEGEDIESGKKSYSVSFRFRDDAKTLTDERVNQVMNRLIDRYQQELKAEIR